MNLEEELLQAWVGITYLFKNSRLTRGLTYNEATIAMYIYHKQGEEKSEVPLKYLQEKTQMTKSLLNRTVDSLVKKGIVERTKGTEDGRTVYVHLSQDAPSEFLEVHRNSLALAQSVIETIGVQDAKTFIEIYKKLEKRTEQSEADFTKAAEGQAVFVKKERQV